MSNTIKSSNCAEELPYGEFHIPAGPNFLAPAPLYPQPMMWSTTPPQDWRTEFDVTFDLKDITAVIVHSFSKGIDKDTKQRKFAHEIRLLTKSLKFIALTPVFDDRKAALEARAEMCRRLGMLT